ncbi:MAG TPA: hypothetical protein VLV83_24115 [Acidobacteriota bacterium]|nr:hypothetical protein [Acidobacteriota bacterium]
MQEDQHHAQVENEAEASRTATLLAGLQVRQEPIGAGRPEDLIAPRLRQESSKKAAAVPRAFSAGLILLFRRSVLVVLLRLFCAQTWPP